MKKCLESWERLVDRRTLIEWVRNKYGPYVFLQEEKNYGDIPIMWRGIYRLAKHSLKVWDDCGSLFEDFRGFVPVEGGTVMYDIGNHSPKLGL